MRLKLFLFMLFFCAITKAQVNLELKDFINKNNIAIRSIQKNMIAENNTAYVSDFKELIKNQQTAVKVFDKQNETSCYFAFLVRNECINYINKYNLGSVEYFNIIDSEKSLIQSVPSVNKKNLTSTEIKLIESMDVFNPNNLNNFILVIQ